MSDATTYTSKLSASRILVIGGSSGIGFAVASACIEHGALVAISSSNSERVEGAVEKIKAAYPSKTSNIYGLTVDLSKPETLESELDNVLSSSAQKLNNKNAGGNGKLDHVIYTAGDALATLPLSSMTYDNVAAAGQIRFFAPLLLAKYLPKYLEQSYKSSYILTTGSISEKPMQNWSVIAGYAAGLHGMVRSLALDLKPIRVRNPFPLNRIPLISPFRHFKIGFKMNVLGE